ncbi:MAG TPA: class I SAM-dependent rRNA methyltransferase [Gammaproteobacteria bacterium]|nr:class I SAM-dependent rRNA methyltransferase [Gammaproteobacteria bacterium]
MSQALPPLRLKKNEERRLRAGHLWVYSNEVDIRQTPLKDLEPGSAVSIEDARGHPIGSGYVNPHSLICARLVSRDPKYRLDKSLLVHRINIALSLRDTAFGAPCYRLVHGEGDNLPGLVVDRFGEVLVVQITTAGMERHRGDVVEALQKVLKPAAIVLRNDSPARQQEGLDSYVDTTHGTLPEELLIEENGARFAIDPLRGQKTGWFFDHRMNRARMQQYVKDQRVLDVFSYIGGWGIEAAVAGASEVLCVEASQGAIDRLHHNADLNGLGNGVASLRGDAFEALKSLRQARERFDVVIVDPPAFIKRKKDFKQGLNAYHRLNQMALQVLNRGGYLISASCSWHLKHEQLRDTILKASRHVDRAAQIVEQGHQGPDHPVHPAIPETDYLKAFIARVLAS